MNTVNFELPKGVSFETPKDYALFCGGNPVQVIPGGPFDGLQIIWDSEQIVFVHGRNRVEYDLERVLGLVVSMSENVHGSLACFLRMCFLEKNERRGLLPILSASQANYGALAKIVDEIRVSSIPLRTFESFQAFRAATGTKDIEPP